MKLRVWMTLAAVAAETLAGIAGISAAEADTIYTGVLSPETVKLICRRADATFNDYGDSGYGCHGSRIMISCRADLNCLSKVRDLNSYLGEPLDRFLQQHGMVKAASTGATP
jgi:hypothetical protein